MIRKYLNAGKFTISKPQRGEWQGGRYRRVYYPAMGGWQWIDNNTSKPITQEITVGDYILKPNGSKVSLAARKANTLRAQALASEAKRSNGLVLPENTVLVGDRGQFMTPDGVVYFTPHHETVDPNPNSFLKIPRHKELTRNAIMPEVVVYPDDVSIQKGLLSKDDISDRERRIRLTMGSGYYEAQKNKEATELAKLRSDKEWENSLTHKALKAGENIAMGLGIGSDIVSGSLGGPPVYSMLKGAQSLDRAVHSGNLSDYAESALWLSPLLGKVATTTYQAGKPYVVGAIEGFRPVYDLTKRRLLGNYRKVRNTVFPKYHDASFLERYSNDRLRKTSAEISKAAGIHQSLSSGKEFLLRRPSPSSIHININPIDNPGSTTEEVKNVIYIQGKPVTARTKRIRFGTQEYELIPNYDLSIDSDFVTRIPVDGSDFLPIKYKARASGRLTFDVENNPEFNKALLEEIRRIEAESGAPVVGSSRLIAEGKFGGVPGDAEVVVPESQLEEVSRKLGFTPGRPTAANTGVTGDAKNVFTGHDPTNLDINVIPNDGTGTIIHQMESTRNPTKMPPIYSKFAELQAKAGNSPELSTSLRIPKDNGSGFYTGDEYFDLIKNNPELLTLSVIDNVFKSSQEKHAGRLYVILNSDNPTTMRQSSIAIDHLYDQIPGMKRFSAAYPEQTFNDVAANKQILEKMEFLPMDVDKFASNPELMKNVVDYWYMRRIMGSHSGTYYPAARAKKLGIKYPVEFEESMSPLRNLGGGDGSGGGGNNVIGGNAGGLLGDTTAYNVYEPRVTPSAKFDDIFNAFKREEEIWRTPEALAAVDEVAKNFGFDPEIFRHEYTPDLFTSKLSELVNNGKISPARANEFIELVADKLQVNGFRNVPVYNNGAEQGGYFGAMVKPNHVAYRNIFLPTDDRPILPAEFGSDRIFFAKNLHSAMDEKTAVATEFSPMTIKEASQKYPTWVKDYSAEHARARALDPNYKNNTDVKNQISKYFDKQDAQRDLHRHIHFLSKRYNQKAVDHNRMWRRTNNIRNASLFGTTLGIEGYFVADLFMNDDSNIKSRFSKVPNGLVALKIYKGQPKAINRMLKEKLGKDFNDEYMTNEEFNKAVKLIIDHNVINR